MSSVVTVESGVVQASIVEAIVDIDCDLPPATSVLDLEEVAKERLRDQYPVMRRVTNGVTALQFVTADEKQVVQFRAEGFSFNLLERYGGAVWYLPEIERTWRIFRDLAAPVQIRAVALRRIDRFLFSPGIGTFDRLRSMSDSFETLEFDGFLNYDSRDDAATGFRVNATMVLQPPEDDRILVLSDIESSDSSTFATEDWWKVQEVILLLDRLTDQVYEHTVTRTWLNLL